MRRPKFLGVGPRDVNNLVFVDESGVNIAMTRLYARALKGERAHGDRPDKRGKNVTMIGAICAKQQRFAIALRGIVGAITFKGGTDTLAFQTYVKSEYRWLREFVAEQQPAVSALSYI